MADIDISQYQIGENTYHYRDQSSKNDIIQLREDVDDIKENHLVPTAEIEKLETVEAHANYTIIDNELSDESEKPVQNKVIKAAIDAVITPATDETLGMIKVGDTLEIDNGVLNINNNATIDPEYTDAQDVVIAQFTNNDGTSGTIKIPFSTIIPETILGDKVKIASFNINGNIGDLYAPQKIGNDIFTGTDTPNNNMGNNGDIYIKHSIYDSSSPTPLTIIAQYIKLEDEWIIVSTS